MLEREVKLRLDKKRLKNITNQLGLIKYFQQKNTIYDLPVGFLRLRKENDTTVITYKSERLNDRFSSREELEFKLDKSQYHIVKEIFEMMGLKESFSFDKKRAEYKLSNSKIFIDHLSTGIYIEIEAETDEDILKTMQDFGFTEEDIEKRSYLEIIQDSNK